MRQQILVAIFIVSFLNCYSQQLSQVTFSGGGSSFAWFTLLTNQNFLIKISDEGNILEYGTEEQSLYNRNYYAQRLLPFAGKINYYGMESDSASKGKIKSIGACFFTYYSAKDYPERAGKMKSAGSLSFDYYRRFEDDLLAGKIKNIGINAIAYYTSFDNEAYKGKLKMVGSTFITYYSSFDDVMIKGKLKTVGAARYT